MSTIEIINTILANEGITASQFSKNIGLTRAQGIYDLLNGRVMRISVRLAKRINDAYPAYSVDWLLTGIEEEAEPPKQESPNDAILEELRSLRKSYERLCNCYEKILTIFADGKD